MTTPQRWYIRRGGTVEGPFDDAAVVAVLGSSRIPVEVGEVGGQQWVPASHHPVFGARHRATTKKPPLVPIAVGGAALLVALLVVAWSQGAFDADLEPELTFVNIEGKEVTFHVNLDGYANLRDPPKAPKCNKASFKNHLGNQRELKPLEEDFVGGYELRCTYDKVFREGYGYDNTKVPFRLEVEYDGKTYKFKESATNLGDTPLSADDD